MSLLKNLKTDTNVKGEEKDTLGGGGPLESDIYLSTIDYAHVIESSKGALGLSLGLKTEDGKNIRETIYFTNKDKQNFYEKDGVKSYLPGFNMVNALTLLTVGKEIGDLDTEEKVIKQYSFESRAEVPTKVNMIVPLLGQQIYVGLLKQVVDKNVKNDAGDYVPSGETREENSIDKLFRAKDKMTVAEIRAEATEPQFFNAWAEKNKGKVVNKVKGGANGKAGAPKAAGAAPGASKPKTSLFG